jgi:hypothetical protein
VNVSDIFGGRDPRDLPRYLVSDAARILDVPRATVHAWVVGRSLPGRADLVPIIQPAAPKSLSFTNLIEVHVLRAMRKEHKVSMANVRDALATLQDQLPGPHPLATRAFLTDGNDLFVEELGRLVQLSNSEQLGLHQQLKLHLKRIECVDAHPTRGKTAPSRSRQTRRRSPSDRSFVRARLQAGPAPPSWREKWRTGATFAGYRPPSMRM